MRIKTLALANGLLITGALLVSANSENRYQQATSSSLAGDFQFSDETAWKVHASPDPANQSSTLELVGRSDYQPPHRSPTSIALLDQHEVGSFSLTVRAQQTGREYGHRDLCFFFNFEGPDRYYYVHLATTPDANAHNIFLVDRADRRNLLPPQQQGVDWGTNVWRTVRIERSVTSGRIAVYFDDVQAPILEAFDKTLTRGLVGVGSFDDTGKFQDLELQSSDHQLVDSRNRFD